MPNFMDEYLLKLGVAVDGAGLARFQTALREASSLVDHESVRMASSFVKAQTAIVGGFAAIGGAAIGLADKVAMSDQSFRLFAMHMYMSKDAARSLKVAMDALNEPLENLSWDPELRGRTHQLIADQRAMAPGEDFEEQMHKIRDIRFEFTRMEVELEYLGMHVVQDFMKMLGMGPDELLVRLEKFNAWVIANMPAISHALSTEFLPIWRDIEHVAEATGEALYDAGLLFTNLVGLFSGDAAIEGTTLNLDKMATAVHHVSGGFAGFAILIAHTEALLAHLVSGITLMSSGKFTEAGAEFKAAGNSITTKEGMELMGGAFGLAFGGPMGAVAGAGAMNVFGTALEDSIGDKPPTSASRVDALMANLRGGKGSNVAAVLNSVAAMLGINPSIAHALAMQESGENQVAVSSTGALGVMQLLPSTARALGVNPMDLGQNVVGGLTLFKHLLDKYGSLPNAIAAYHEGEGKMNSILAGKATLSSEAKGEVAGVLARLGQTGSVTVGSIVINIPEKHATNQAVASVVAQKIKDLQNKQVQRNLLEFQAQGTSY